MKKQSKAYTPLTVIQSVIIKMSLLQKFRKMPHAPEDVDNTLEEQWPFWKHGFFFQFYTALSSRQALYPSKYAGRN